jgi:hypothetical protein
MQIRKIAVAAAASAALALSLVSVGPASADYAPSPSDAVGVGSDTLQFAVDFVADGNHLGGAGYNSLGNANKWVNFDATADSNARLSYGVSGNNGTTGASGTLVSSISACTAGTGKKKGTGNATATHAEASSGVCQLNNTVILREGMRPIQRPNGSGAGTAALAKDMLGGLKNIDYARSSDLKGATFTSAGVPTSRISIGQEDFAMATYSDATASNASGLTAGLSASEIVAIYSANIGSCKKWSDFNVNASTDFILPIFPQTSSGTYSFWSGTLGVAFGSATIGTCAISAEENDPLAIQNAVNPSYAVANSKAAKYNAIEPMSGARLNLWNGKKGDGTNNKPSGANPFFTDPSCAYGDSTVDSAGTTGFGTTGDCGTITVSNGGVGMPKTVSVVGVTQATSTGWWKTTRNIYIYFRQAEMNNVTDPFQPGVNQNLVRTLFANECSGQDFSGTTLSTSVTTGAHACSTTTEAYGSHTWGPGGAPVIAQSAYQTLISTAGFRPDYAYVDAVTSAQ